MMETLNTLFKSHFWCLLDYLMVFTLHTTSIKKHDLDLPEEKHRINVE